MGPSGHGGERILARRDPSPGLLAADVPPGGATVDALLASPTVRMLAPGDRFCPLLKAAVEEGQVNDNRIFDAQLVATCREHGVATILSEDRDFRRFPSITLQTL